MEKTPIERLFNVNPLEKEDIHQLVASINDVISIVNAQQKTIVELKTSVEALTKKLGENSSIIMNMTTKLDTITDANTAALNSLGNTNGFQFQSQGFPQQYQQRPIQQQMMPQRNNVPLAQPRQTGNGTLGFDPMSVSAPNTNIHGDVVSKMTQQQLAAAQRQINSQQR